MEVEEKKDPIPWWYWTIRPTDLDDYFKKKKSSSEAAMLLLSMMSVTRF